MNRIDMGYKHYREFAENLLQVKMNDLAGNYDDISIARSVVWAKEEIDRRMQKIFDQMYYYGFKPTCDMVEESRNNTWQITNNRVYYVYSKLRTKLNQIK